MKAAFKVEESLEVPQGTADDVERNHGPYKHAVSIISKLTLFTGLLRLRDGDHVFSRDPNGSGDAKDDVLQAWVTRRFYIARVISYKVIVKTVGFLVLKFRRT